MARPSFIRPTRCGTPLRRFDVTLRRLAFATAAYRFACRTPQWILDDGKLQPGITFIYELLRWYTQRLTYTLSIFLKRSWGRGSDDANEEIFGRMEDVNGVDYPTSRVRTLEWGWCCTWDNCQIPLGQDVDSLVARNNLKRGGVRCSE